MMVFNSRKRKRRGFLAALVLLCVVRPVLAAEPVAGDACTTNGAFTHAGGPEQSGAGQFLTCNGSVWVSVLEHTAAGRSNLQISNDTGGCTAAKTGRLRYNETTDTWEYCTGSVWNPFERAGSAVCNIFGQLPGYVCPDGTVFAGFPPDSYYPVFVTRCDAGQTWSGSACTGTRTTYKWGSSGTLRGVTSATDGAGNTATLAAFGSSSHPAAYACANLNEDGHDDWYLPSRAELYTAWLHSAAIGGFDIASGTHWTSSESDSTGAVYQKFSDGIQAAASAKTNPFEVRCARKN